MKVTLGRACALFVVALLATLPSTLSQISEGRATPARAAVRTTFETSLSRDTRYIPPSRGPSGWPLVLEDPLTDNTKGSYWNVTNPDERGSCRFSPGGYQVISSSPQNIRSCFARAYSFSDVAFEVTMQIITGSEGGIALYGNQGNLYVFNVHQNGYFTLAFYTTNSSNGPSRRPLADNPLPVSVDLSQPNRIAIIIQNGSLSLYINGEPVEQHSWPTVLHSEWIGLTAGTSSLENSAEVTYSDAKIWAPNTLRASLSPESPPESGLAQGGPGQ